jgi:hypothetical protein
VPCVLGSDEWLWPFGLWRLPTLYPLFIVYEVTYVIPYFLRDLT